MSNTIFDLQLQDRASGQSIITAGGTVFVAVAGSAKKATLLNPDAGYAPMANPVAPIRGKVRFAVANTAGASPGSTIVDVYGISPAGHFFIVRGMQTGNPTEVFLDLNNRQEIAVVPFSILDTIANTEQDTGFDFPLNCLIQPPPLITVRTLEAGRTINVGLLSSQTGGNASGFVSGVSLAAAGPVKSTLAGASTLGALLKVTSGGTPVPEDAVITTSARLTFTLSAGTTVADGFICIPYQLTA